jgi:Sap-like sulfolipid-1-addressing protein
VIAMLAGRHPRRLLASYVVAGFVFSFSVGAAVVLLLEGWTPAHSARLPRPFIDTGVGAAALCYAAAVWIGWLPRRRYGRPSHVDLLRSKLEDVTPLWAAAAGVLTHLPGLVYLAALNAIVASGRGPLGELLQVGVYNLIWFSLAIATLVMAARHPDTAGELLGRLGRWGRRHQRVIIITFCGSLGGYLLVTGLFALLKHPA